MAVAAPKDRLIVDANFTGHDGSGCITTEVFVFVRGNAGGNNAKLNLEVSQTDDCKDEVLLTARGKVNVGGGSFRISPDLSSASVNATLTLTDRTNRRDKKSIVVTVRLTWVGVEEIISADTAVFPVEPGQFERLGAKARRTLRLAKASGTVSEGTTNLTPQPTTDASMSFEGTI